MGEITMLELILGYAGGFALLWISGHVIYMQVHMEEEKRAGKGLPLYWEEGGWYYNWKHRNDAETFDKSKVKYFDGDNT